MAPRGPYSHAAQSWFLLPDTSSAPRATQQLLLGWSPSSAHSRPSTHRAVHPVGEHVTRFKEQGHNVKSLDSTRKEVAGDHKWYLCNTAWSPVRASVMAVADYEGKWELVGGLAADRTPSVHRVCEAQCLRARHSQRGEAEELRGHPEAGEPHLHLPPWSHEPLFRCAQAGTRPLRDWRPLGSRAGSVECPRPCLLEAAANYRRPSVPRATGRSTTCRHSTGSVRQGRPVPSRHERGV